MKNCQLLLLAVLFSGCLVKLDENDVQPIRHLDRARGQHGESNGAETVGKAKTGKTFHDISPTTNGVGRSTVQRKPSIYDHCVLEYHVKGLSSISDDVRFSSAIAITYRADNEEALIPLLCSLGDPVRDVRLAVTRALGKIEDTPEEPLLLALEDLDPFVRIAAIEALDTLKYRSQSYSDALVRILRNRNTAVEPVTSKVKKVLGHDADFTPRVKAAWALGWKGNTSAVMPLIDVLGDEDSMVVNGALSSLGNIGDTNAIEPFAALLNDSKWGLFSAISLCKLRDARSLHPLITYLKAQRHNGGLCGVIIYVLRSYFANDAMSDFVYEQRLSEYGWRDYIQWWKLLVEVYEIVWMPTQEPEPKKVD
jgi:hypothetical protein